MLDLAGTNLDEIATALQDQTAHEYCWLIDPRTGEIKYWSEELGIDGQNPVDLDELVDLGLVVIHALPARVWYRDMADFAAGISDPRAQDRLTGALHGQGAFRRFKNALYEGFPHLVDAWSAWRDHRASRRAVEWLADHDLIDEATLERYLEEHPAPELP
jgi:hypothetical protein